MNAMKLLLFSLINSVYVVLLMKQNPINQAADFVCRAEMIIHMNKANETSITGKTQFIQFTIMGVYKR